MQEKKGRDERTDFTQTIGMNGVLPHHFLINSKRLVLPHHFLINSKVFFTINENQK